MNKSCASIGIILITMLQLVATDEKCSCNKPKPKPKEVSQIIETEQTHKSCSCCSSCSSCCKGTESCNCIGEAKERKCSCCSSCTKPCCKTLERCSCNKPKPHRTNQQYTQPNKQDDSSQRILAHFADIVENFAQIVKNPDDTQNVAEQMTHMFAGVIKIAAEGTRSESERQAIQKRLSEWLDDYFESAQDITRNAIKNIHSH